MTWNINDSGNTPPPPGGFGGPPPPPGMPGPSGAQPPVGPPSATSTFGDAWETFKQSWVPPTVVIFAVTIAPFIALMMMLMPIILESSKPEYEKLTTDAKDARMAEVAPGPALFITVVVLLIVANVVAHVAMYRAGLLATSGQKVTYSNMFRDIPWATTTIASLLSGIAMAVGFVLCFIPGLLLAGMFLLLTPALIDGRGFGGAFSHAWKFGKQNFGYVMALIGFGFLIYLAAYSCFIVAIPATYLTALISVCAYRASEGKAVTNA